MLVVMRIGRLRPYAFALRSVTSLLRHGAFTPRASISRRHIAPPFLITMFRRAPLPTKFLFCAMRGKPPTDTKYLVYFVPCRILSPPLPPCAFSPPSPRAYCARSVCPRGAGAIIRVIHYLDYIYISDYTFILFVALGYLFAIYARELNPRYAWLTDNARGLNNTEKGAISS